MKRLSPSIKTGLALLITGAILTSAFYLPVRYEVVELRGPGPSVRVAGPLRKGDLAEYRFRSPVGRLAGLDIRWAAYARRNDSTLHLALFSAGKKKPLAAVHLDAAEVPDFGFSRWRFGPLKVETGRELNLLISSPDADETSCLALLISDSPPQAETPTAYLINGQTISGTLPIRLHEARPLPGQGVFPVWLAVLGVMGLVWLWAWWRKSGPGRTGRNGR